VGRTRWLIGATVLLVTAGLGARVSAEILARRALRARQITWESVQPGPTGTRWRGLHGEGLSVSSAHLSLLPRPSVALQGVEVQGRRLLDLSQSASPFSGPFSGPSPVAEWLARETPVRVEDLRLKWGDETLFDDLSGTLSPTLHLTSQGTSLTRDRGGWQADLTRPLDLGAVSGTLSLQARSVEGLLGFDVQAPDLVLSHPTLAPSPLPSAPLRVHGSWHPDSGQIDATGSLGGLQLTASGQVDPTTRLIALDLSIDAELADVVALFGDQIPEARRADCTGSVGLDLTVSTPPLRWRATARAQDLRCTGLLSDIDALKSGRATWRAVAADGTPTIARVGPDIPGFTSWLQGRRVAEAIIASEDINFLTHPPGYVLGAIQEALDQAADGVERPRGGSTLTQQLAKNLFLDGQRTLLRKLRELLYALCLEDALDKRHILQLYINVVELGPDLRGVGPAADAYFAKPAAGLTDREAAFLATLLPAPKRGYARAARGRVNQAAIDRVLDNLERSGLRSSQAMARARHQSLRLLLAPPSDPPSSQHPSSQHPWSQH